MTYNDFIAQYPWVDLVLNIFGNIAPVIVAILAIIVNNTKSSNRDKRNKKIDMIVGYENLLIDKISKLEDSLDNLFNAFLEILKCKEFVDVQITCETYELEKKKVSKCKIELFNISFCASEILKENVNTECISDDIQKVIVSMDDMIKKHLSDGIINDMYDKQNQKIKQIMEDIIDVKSWLQVDIKRVTEKTFCLLK